MPACAPGASTEWKDEPNRLHFYVVALRRDDAGILSYTVAIRSMDSPGGQRRGVQVEMDEAMRVNGTEETILVTVRNTGGATDLFRISVNVEEPGWTAALGNALAAVPGGQTATIPVRITRPATAARPGTLVFTATSESDPTKKSSVTAALTAGR